MTEDEKDLEQKIKQYQYAVEDAKKKLESLQNDMNKKGKKKSFIYKLSHTLGNIVFVWSGIGFAIFGFLLIFAVYNYFHELSKFDIVKQVETKYDMNLKQISREAGDKKILYEVKPTKWKYRKIHFKILQDGGDIRIDDFKERYLKYIIEKMKQKELLNDFEIIERYTENDILEYKLLYKGNDNNKINKLKDYILDFDKHIERILKLDDYIMNERDEKISHSF